MNIYALIQELEDWADRLGEDAEVFITADYGDITHTEQILDIQSVEMKMPKKSAYSTSGTAVDPDWEPEDKPNGTGIHPVLTLRGVRD